MRGPPSLHMNTVICIGTLTLLNPRLWSLTLRTVLCYMVLAILGGAILAQQSTGKVCHLGPSFHPSQLACAELQGLVM